MPAIIKYLHDILLFNTNVRFLPQVSKWFQHKKLLATVLNHRHVSRDKTR